MTIDVKALVRDPRHRRKLVGAGAAGAIVLVILGVWALGGNDESQSRDELAQGGAAEGSPITPGAPPSPVAGEPGADLSAPGPGEPGGPATGGGQAAESVAGEARAVGQPEPEVIEFRSPVRCSAEGQPNAAPLPGDSANNGKRWVTVQRLTGACDLSSPAFELRGVDTRIAWRSDAGSFAAFLTDPARPDASAGYADANCAGPCSEYQYVVLPAADYTLRVQADGGPWEVVVQEYR